MQRAAETKATLRRQISRVTDILRSPVRRPSVLLVTGNAAPEKIAEVEDRLRFVLAHFDHPMEIRRSHHASMPAYLLHSGVAAADPSAISSFAQRRLDWVVDLDYETNPVDAWNLIDLGAAMSRKPDRKILEAAFQRFVRHVRQLKELGPRPVYLFGTGPSLQSATGRSFADGTTVVCNTTVRDQQLWHHLQPSFLAAGDAIYHFGSTQHAKAFRADALLRLQESNGRTLFVYPHQYDFIVRSEFKAVESLLVPVPRGTHTDPTTDLTRNFSLPPMGNVLGDLLLPLGCTLSTDVRFWGFDGRAPEDRGFWANAPGQSYPELMSALRDSHPAFFHNNVPEGNEVQYVQKVHGDLLDERLTDAERRGYQFHMLHHSWTPTFQKRYRETASDQG